MDSDYQKDINGPGQDGTTMKTDTQGELSDCSFKKIPQYASEVEAAEAEGLNGVSGTALAVISTIMGGGIVSIPYAYAVTGFWMGLVI